MDNHNQTFRTTFMASATPEGSVCSSSGEVEKRARKLADDFFAGRPYHLDVHVTEHRTLGGSSLGFEVDVTATLNPGGR